MAFKSKTVRRVRGYRRMRKLNPRQAQQVKRIVGQRIETKSFDQGYEVNATTAGDVKSITGTLQGDANYERIGDEIVVKKILFRYMINIPEDELIPFVDHDAFVSVRIVLFKWHLDDTITLPSQGSLFSTVGPSPIKMFNFDDRDKYTIVYDKVHHVGTTPVFDGTDVDLAAYAGSVYTTRSAINLFGKKLGSHKINYVDNLATGMGNYYVYVGSDSSTIPHPTVSYTTQVHYTDA